MGSERPRRTNRGRGKAGDRLETGATHKWFCGCKEPPVLLGTLDASGEIHLKSRDRYWHVRGSVTAVCPLCGCEHMLEPGVVDRPAVILQPLADANHEIAT